MAPDYVGKNVFLHSLDTNVITADTLKICGQLCSIHVQQIMPSDMVHALAAAAPGLVSLGVRVSDTATCMALVAFPPSKAVARGNCNFEIVVNHITIKHGHKDQLPRVSRESITALKHVSGHNIKKYSGTFHHKPGNDHVHFLVVSEAPNTKSAVKARNAASMALMFGTETGFVEVKMFNEMKADAGPAHGLKGLGEYRSLYVNNNDHESPAQGS